MGRALGAEPSSLQSHCLGLGGIVMGGLLEALGGGSAAPHSTGTGAPAPGFQGPAPPAVH